MEFSFPEFKCFLSIINMDSMPSSKSQQEEEEEEYDLITIYDKEDLIANAFTYHMSI